MPTKPQHVHVIGAGLAGLSAALNLVDRGIGVTVHEAGPRAGGRCRSYFDPVLDCVIDNGNHLMLSGNTDIAAYQKRIGAEGTLLGPDRAEIPFLDLETGERWTFRPSPGRSPVWLFDKTAKAPGTGFWDYLKGLRLAKPGRTVSQAVGATGQAYRRFWEPLAVGVLNTEPEAAEASLLWRVLMETIARGEAACRPRIAEKSLAESLIDPAVAALKAAGAEIRFSKRLRSLEGSSERVTALHFSEEVVRLTEADAVLMAVPAPVLAGLLGGALADPPPLPTETRAIVNLHFRLPEPRSAFRLQGLMGGHLLGLVGGVGQWIFLRDGLASVTVSAADDLASKPAEDIAALIWPEVARALDLKAENLPPFRVVKEKRATFAQTPEAIRLRPPPGPLQGLKNLILSGDWTDTGLPATIEGSIRSGRLAVNAALQ
ncbi:MAG: hydroxysqualene dehydroxylase HpnE [Magnetovibrionaceae bacterium]